MPGSQRRLELLREDLIACIVVIVAAAACEWSALPVNEGRLAAQPIGGGVQVQNANKCSELCSVHAVSGIEVGWVELVLSRDQPWRSGRGRMQTLKRQEHPQHRQMKRVSACASRCLLCKFEMHVE